MICPGFKWKKWPEVLKRSLEIHRDAIAWTNQNAAAMVNPAKEDVGFAESEDLWLQESADVIGIDRSMMERLVAAGQIEWRENYGQGFEIRYDGVVLPMKTKPVSARAIEEEITG